MLHRLVCARVACTSQFGFRQVSFERPALFATRLECPHPKRRSDAPSTTVDSTRAPLRRTPNDDALRRCQLPTLLGIPKARITHTARAPGARSVRCPSVDSALVRHSRPRCPGPSAVLPWLPAGGEPHARRCSSTVNGAFSSIRLPGQLISFESRSVASRPEERRERHFAGPATDGPSRRGSRERQELFAPQPQLELETEFPPRVESATRREQEHR